MHFLKFFTLLYFIQKFVVSSNATHGEVYSIQNYVLLSVIFFGYSSFLHNSNLPPLYTWNIVESGVEHHRPESNPVIQKLEDHPIKPFIFKKYDTRMYMYLVLCKHKPCFVEKYIDSWKIYIEWDFYLPDSFVRRDI